MNWTSLTKKASRFQIPHSARFVAPIFLGAALIGIVLSTLHFGGKRESLAAYAEARLLQFALRQTAAPASSSKKVITISVKNSDLQTIKLAPHQILKDAHITEYASILERVAVHNPRLIVVSWLTAAHPFTVDYLRPLTDTIDKLGIASKTIIAVHLYTTGAVPEELSRKYNIAEARDCYYEINAFCTLNPEWTWMPQQIVKEFWTTKRPWTVSENLPHTLPNFVLNLPQIESLTEFSFLDFRPPVAAEILEGSSIFIGNDANQELHFRENKDLLQKTFVSSSQFTRSLMSDGIPFHVFWAAMAQMFLDDATVAVVPLWLTNIAVILMCLAILFAIKKLKGLALGPFLVCALGLPIANIIGIRFAKVYLPVVPLISVGFAMFTAVTFFSVATNSYRKWRLQAKEKSAESTSDIKENFISLISHNLNTPIAQLRGLLDILYKESNFKSQNLNSARIHLETLRLTVRAVLDTSSLSDATNFAQKISLKKLWQNFTDSELLALTRLGISIQVHPLEEDENEGEVWFYNFLVEESLVRSALQYAVFLGKIKSGCEQVHLAISPVNFEPGDPQGLKLDFTWKPGTQTLQKTYGSEFIEKALLRYLNQLKSIKKVDLALNPQGLQIIFFEPHKSVPKS